MRSVSLDIAAQVPDITSFKLGYRWKFLLNLRYLRYFSDPLQRIKLAPSRKIQDITDSSIIILSLTRFPTFGWSKVSGAAYIISCRTEGSNQLTTICPAFIWRGTLTSIVRYYVAVCLKSIRKDHLSMYKYWSAILLSNEISTPQEQICRRWLRCISPVVILSHDWIEVGVNSSPLNLNLHWNALPSVDKDVGTDQLREFTVQHVGSFHRSQSHHSERGWRLQESELYAYRKFRSVITIDSKRAHGKELLDFELGNSNGWHSAFNSTGWRPESM